jgi:orotate phosphoribosyltransferase-like protein
MTPRAMTLEDRRRRRARYTELRRQGLTMGQIAESVGVSRQAVQYALRRADWAPLALTASVHDRPDWSRPDAELLRLAREGRAEIEEALRRSAT